MIYFCMSSIIHSYQKKAESCPLQELELLAVFLEFNFLNLSLFIWNAKVSDTYFSDFSVAIAMLIYFTVVF